VIGDSGLDFAFAIFSSAVSLRFAMISPWRKRPG